MDHPHHERKAEASGARPPRRILLVSQLLGQGGSERQLAEIAKTIDRRRFEPAVACMREPGIRAEDLAAAGVPVEVFPVRSLFSPSLVAAAAKLARYLRRNAIELVHAFDVPSSVFAVPTARAAGVPVVLSSQRAHRTLVGPHVRILLRAVDRLSHGIVVNCRAVARHLRRDFSVPESRIHLCYNGIDLTRFRRVETPRAGPLHGADLVVGVVCALRSEKGLPTLVKAFARLAGRRPGARLLIVGSGPEGRPLRRLAGELGALDRCLFIDQTPHVTPWLNQIDVFVLPSLSEALSNSLMEAMACGCAAVASRVGGNPELVCDGDNPTGLLFEAGDEQQLADRLETLAADPDLRARLGANAERFIRGGFSIDRAARRMAEIYSQWLP